jgi:hypothetical protein
LRIEQACDRQFGETALRPVECFGFGRVHSESLRYSVLVLCHKHITHDPAPAEKCKAGAVIA